MQLEDIITSGYHKGKPRCQAMARGWPHSDIRQCRAPAKVVGACCHHHQPDRVRIQPWPHRVLTVLKRFYENAGGEDILELIIEADPHYVPPPHEVEV